MSTPPAAPLGFLDLPPEIRIMIYKRITITTEDRLFKVPTASTQQQQQDTPNKEYDITLFAKSLPVSFLATCQLIKAECEPYMAPLLATLRRESVHFVVSSPDDDQLSENGDTADGAGSNEESEQVDADFAALASASIEPGFKQRFGWMMQVWATQDDYDEAAFPILTSPMIAALDAEDRAAIVQFNQMCSRYLYYRSPREIVLSLFRLPNFYTRDPDVALVCNVLHHVLGGGEPLFFDDGRMFLRFNRMVETS